MMEIELPHTEIAKMTGHRDKYIAGKISENQERLMEYGGVINQRQLNNKTIYFLNYRQMYELACILPNSDKQADFAVWVMKRLTSKSYGQNLLTLLPDKEIKEMAIETGVTVSELLRSSEDYTKEDEKEIDHLFDKHNF